MPLEYMEEWSGDPWPKGHLDPDAPLTIDFETVYPPTGGKIDGMLVYVEYEPGVRGWVRRILERLHLLKARAWWMEPGSGEEGHVRMTITPGGIIRIEPDEADR